MLDDQGLTVIPADRGPEDIPETPEVFRKLIEHCMGLFKAFRDSDYRKKKKEKIDKARKVYEQEREDVGFPFAGASNIELPLTAITVDNIEPRMVAALVGKDPFVNFETEGKADPITEILQDFYNDELKKVVKLERVAMDEVHNILLEGTLFILPRYAVEKKMVRDFVFDQQGQIALQPTGELNEDGTPGAVAQTTDQEIVAHEGGKLEIIPFEDMYWPDNLGTIEEWEAGDKVRRVEYEYGELMRAREEAGFKPENIGPWLFGQKGKKERTEGGEIVVTGKEKIECLEFYVTYPIFQDQTKEWRDQEDFREERILVTITKESKTVVRLLRQREILFSGDSIIKRIRLFPESGKTCGSSMYEKLASIQEGSSDMFNQILNVAWITMMPWFFYDSKSGLGGEVELYPGKGIPVENVQGVLIPQWRTNPNQYIEFLNTLLTMWERIGNVSDWNIGRQNEVGGKRTATEVMSVIQEGNIAHNYRANSFKEEFIIVLRALWDLYYQWMPFTKVFMSQGKQVQIPRKAMKRDYQFSISGSTETANKMIERKEAEDLLNILGQDPLANPMKIREDLLKAYGKDNIEEYLNPQVSQLIAALMQNPELIQVVQKYLQTKAQIAGAVGGEQGGKPAGGPPTAPQGGFQVGPQAAAQAMGAAA